MADIYAFHMDGDHAVSAWSGTNATKGVPPGALECTLAQHTQFSNAIANPNSAVFPGSKLWRFTYIADVLTELVDPRPTVTWLDTEGFGTTDGDGNVIIGVDAGQSPPKIRIRHGDPTHKQVDYARCGDKKSLKLDWNDGDALLDIESTVQRVVKYDRCDLYNMTNRLDIRVNAVTL